MLAVEFRNLLTTAYVLPSFSLRLILMNKNDTELEVSSNEEDRSLQITLRAFFLQSFQLECPRLIILYKAASCRIRAVST